jgi:drug/metabolite transporter (DMT)-like permease
MKSLGTGVSAALGAAFLFGSGTPVAKMLLASVGPWMLAGLFYLGSGVGLTLYRLAVGAPSRKLAQGEALWLGGAILAGGVLGPLLLMFGLSAMSASGASLLLNAEGVFTALLAWVVFKENVDFRIALGMGFIAAGAMLLSWPDEVSFAGMWPTLAVLGACFAWGIDNNLTRKVSLNDATWIAAVKGIVAGVVNLSFALWIGDKFPSAPIVAAAMAVGFLAYGVSLALFVLGLRQLGTARTGAYFCVAPFFGALLAILGGEPLKLEVALAAALMLAGVWLHVTEKHDHLHDHEALNHEHEHEHDEHHLHEHSDGENDVGKHSHAHHHTPITHRHEHYPDAHHRHTHLRPKTNLEARKP